MIMTTKMLLEQYRRYANPMSKVRRLVKDGKLTPIVRGLYETDPDTPGHYLAGSIYGPSYLSFEFALCRHGLIPETVLNYTCATFDKRRGKRYDTPFGAFVYRDIPKAAYPLGAELIMENGYSFQLASPEKALCDQLYGLPPLGSQRELQRCLAEDLRIDEDSLARIEKNDVGTLAGLYGSTNVKLLAAWLGREAIK